MANEVEDSVIESLIDNNVNYIKPALLRSVLYYILGRIPGPADGVFSVEPPLSYDPFENIFRIDEASSVSNGFLSKEDYVKFSSYGQPNPAGNLKLIDKGYFNGEPNTENSLQPGDMVRGFKDATEFWDSAIYTGGNPSNRDNYIPIVTTLIPELPI